MHLIFSYIVSFCPSFKMVCVRHVLFFLKHDDDDDDDDDDDGNKDKY